MKRSPALRESKAKSSWASVGIVASKVASKVAWTKASKRAVRRRGSLRQYRIGTERMGRG